jgi:hypothetical protein
MVLDDEAMSPAGVSGQPVHPLSKIIPVSGPAKSNVHRNNSVWLRARTKRAA